MRVSEASLILLLLVTGTGCGEPHKSARGFHLPDGDPQRGQAAFVDMKCNACHTVSGVELPAPVAATVVRLGGSTPRVRTDGSLVTAVIDPSHAVMAYPGREAGAQLSPMGDFSEILTVRELIDVVAFLQEHYQVLPTELGAR